ncbi:MAG: signal recognition particle-docking protein FtsY [Eubacteriaceae bacterium]|nr:signal recognition particle-docking protein FtsY [Eubacteriaceae bacterium]MCR4894630.1 signal recognition particle-docking protein FtsY [Eubacteriales bacterium]
MEEKKLDIGFLRTKKTLGERFREVFTGSIDDELYDELLEALILSDIPYDTSEKILDGARKNLRRGEMDDLESVKDAVRQSIADILSSHESFTGFELPAVVMVMGVNGVGKTTTIAKIANMYASEGKSVMLAAADTFRAAASEQLGIWAERIGVPVISSQQGQDAASVIYDAVSAAKSRGVELLICDTAGRLHNNKNLMEELRKMYRVAEKASEGFRLYTVVVLDAMTGASSLTQLAEFSEIRKPDGVVITKTDGSAKGGMVIAAVDKYDAGVYYVGVGEGLDDICLFDAKSYADAII